MSRTSRRLSILASLLTAGAIALLVLSANSQTPAGSVSGAPLASGAATAAPSSSGTASSSGAAAAPPPSNVLRGADIPTEASDVPESAKDWESARVVSPSKGANKDCVFKILREWLRVDCDDRLGAALIAGDPADVRIWAYGQPKKEPKARIVMAVRRGESKLFELAVVKFYYEWEEPAAGERLSIVWRDGDADPTLLLSPIPQFNWW